MKLSNTTIDKKNELNKRKKTFQKHSSNEKYSEKYNRILKYRTKKEPFVLNTEYKTAKTTKKINNDDDSFFHKICYDDRNIDLILRLKPKKYEIQCKNSSGETPLFIAIKMNNFKISKYLLENGANVLDKNIQNKTPLDYALMKKNKEMIKLVKEYISKSDKKDEDLSSINSHHEHCIIDVSSINETLDLIGNVNLSGNQNENKLKKIYSKKVISHCASEKDFYKIKMKKRISNGRHLSMSNLNSVNENDKFKLTVANTSIFTINSKSAIKIKKNSTLNSLRILKDDNRLTNIETNFPKKFEPILSDKMPFSAQNKFFDLKNKNKMVMTLINSRDKTVIDQMSNEDTNDYKFIPQQSEYYETKKETVNQNFQRTSDTLQQNSNYGKTYQNNSKDDSMNKSKDLKLFLEEIKMVGYYNFFAKSGFDDLQIMLKQMYEENYLSFNLFKNLGIERTGDAAKILIRFQELNNQFDFKVPFETVYYTTKVIDPCLYVSDTKLYKLYIWLSKTGMDIYFNNFFENGYYTVELILIQALSFFPFTDDLLKNELKILNELHRVVLLNYFMDEAEELNKSLIIKKEKENIDFRKTNPIKKDCECSIF